MTRLVLGRLPLALPALAAGWLLVALPLLLLGAYRPLPAVALGGPAALALAWFVVRRTPDLDGPAWAGWLTLAVVVGFLVLAWGWSSEHVVLRRDAGSYGLYADWLAQHGRLPIPSGSSGFGPDVSFASPGFFQRGTAIVPQFLSGTPLLLAPAGWVAGLAGILHADALVGAAALLAVAGVAARLAGARGAPFAALGTGLAYPVLHAARSPYSEPLAMLLLFGGLALLAERRLPLVGGLLAGLATLARIDAPADLLLLVPYAVLAARTGRGSWRLVAGLGLGVGVGLLDGIVLSRPYVATVAGELFAITAAAVLLAVAALALRRWVARPQWLPWAAAAGITLAGIGFALRPLVQVVRRPTSAAGMIGALQERQGLPRDPTRTYDEHSLHWLAWWVGWPAVALAVAGLALLARDRLRSGPSRYDAAPFLLVVAGATAAVLLRPSITPDHPWADRRLVPVVVPGLAVCAAWLVASSAGRLPRWAVAILGTLALVPVGVATAPLLGAATERGEASAVSRLCERLDPRAAVVITGSRGRNELPQTVRGRCGVPVAVVAEDRLAATLPTVDAAVRRTGRHLVVVAESADVLTAAGLRPEPVVDLGTREDARLLARRPSRAAPLRVQIWTATR